MSARKGARLWLQPTRRDRNGKLLEHPVWVIRDGARKRSTGFGESQTAQAEAILAKYIADKYRPSRSGKREADAVKVADVLSIYDDDVISRHSRPKETAARLERILDFFGSKTLSHINETSCTEYVRWRGAPSAARRELEDFRAAIRHHWKAGLCSSLTPVVLPPKGEPRERWLTRSEAARLLWAAWRHRQSWKGMATGRATGKHLARFVLVALYTGTRAGAICGAALTPTENRGWLDDENGVFYRRPRGRKRTKKRQPPRLLAHIRRWKHLGIAQDAIVEWNGKPVKRINKAFRSVRRAAGLGADVVPHTLRHTAITWTAQAGVPKHEILGFFGITEEMFERVYGHHHPDYQQNAVNALSRPRQNGQRTPRQVPDRLAATKRERTASNATNGV
jgi:integrase